MGEKLSEVECIKGRKPWSEIPAEIKSKFNHDEQRWREHVVAFCVANQLPYRATAASLYIPKDETYYTQLVTHSRTNLLLYPYHIQQRVVRLCGITPFQYYCDLLLEQLASERSYDSIPNFTANDCLQLIGIGRNQYIDIVIAHKSHKSWSLVKKSFKQSMPKFAKVWDSWEPWWVARVGTIHISDMENFSEAEKYIVDILIDKHGSECGFFDKDVLASLFARNFLIFDVPVLDEDRFTVPKLESFVMNRVQGDYMELLMYKVIVALDENTSLKDLAILLDADLISIKQAISLFCRLGLIIKKNSSFDVANLHPSWLACVGKRSMREVIKKNSGSIDTTRSNGTADTLSLSEDIPAENFKRIGFIYDSTLTAFLMVGNLSQELKTYAMTMFEMGKLTHEMMTDFLEKLSETTEHNEGEAKHYYNNAMNLLKTLRFLREKNDSIFEWYENDPSQLSEMPVDMIHNESLKNLSRSAMLKHFEKKYILLISMAPLSNIISPVSCSFPPFFGPSISELNSFWYKLFIYHTVRCGPPSILIPRGSILIVVPHIFKGYENLYVISPDQPANIIPKAHCLHIINDLLKHACVLIQGFSYDQEVHNKLYHLAFPFDEKLFIKNEKIYQMMQVLKSEHNLTHGFGFVTLIKIEKKSSLKRRDTILSECSHKPSGSSFSLYDNIQGDSLFPNNSTFCFEDAQIITAENIDSVMFDNNRFDWFPFEITYGMPLFSSHLNQSICANILRNKLFSSQSIMEHTRQNRKMILELIDFITNFEGSRPELTLNKIVNTSEKNIRFFPTKSVTFYRDSISLWTIHDEL